jgi:hypothetical protein
MRKLGAWLGIVALALQVAWPLLAVAKPRSVVLVPLCTVDGTTHYLELPTGKAPLERSSAHREHCPACFVGERAALPARLEAPALLEAPAERLTKAGPALAPKSVRITRSARAPALPSLTTV